MLQLEIAVGENENPQSHAAFPSQGDQQWLPMFEPTLLRNLMQVGYLAVGRGCFAEARAIFHGLIAMRPASEIPLLGLVVTEMSAGDFAKANEFMEAAVHLQPNTPHTLAIKDVLQQCCAAKGYGHHERPSDLIPFELR